MKAKTDIYFILSLLKVQKGLPSLESFIKNDPEKGEYRLDKWTEISYQKLNEMNNEQSDFEKKSETIINNLEQLK